MALRRNPLSGQLDYFEPPGSIPAMPHALLSATHPDVAPAAPVRGDLLVGNATPAWARFPKGAADRILAMNAGGTDPEWRAASSLVGSFDHGGLLGLGDDDHSQYALLAGRSGGQTLEGGTAASEILTLRGTHHTTDGRIHARDELRLRTSQADLTGGEVFGARCDLAANVTDGVGSFRALGVTGTLTHTVAPSFSNHNVFSNLASVSVTAGGALPLFAGFANQPTVRADGVAITVGSIIGFLDNPLVEAVGGGTIGGSANVQGYSAGARLDDADVALDTRLGFRMTETAGALGTLALQAGLKVETLTRGTTNLSVWSTGAAVDQRHAGGVRLGSSVAGPDTLLHLTGTGSRHGSLTLEEETTNPTAPSAVDRCRLYMKADKLVVQVYNAGAAAVRYFWLDLTATSNQSWTFSAAAP